ncbi:MAG: alpha/beta hydrolase [Gammaproteobacteria bacterium]|nr:alpha/beta hydrolase [Gammaproteobacteria bacterium]MDE0273428.1 alpha/beta hydrolase [Gammaproteobacteria bacterium]
MSLSNIRQRRVATNGISLNIAEQGEGPLVLMLHGFPESWYSWRHQFAPLAAAGFHAVAPDMRGYGKSDKPHEISAYNQVEVVADIIGLIPALGAETAVVIGHDWGAPTAWSAAAQHPDQVRAVGTLSVPFSPRPEAPPLDMLREAFKGQFFYQLYFQEPGVAEAEFEVDIRTALRKFLFLASGQSDASTLATKQPDDDLLSGLPDPEVLPPWLTEADLEFYTGEFERSGFRGPLNYYRNHNLTWRLTEGAPAVIEQPALFAAGEKDGVILMAAEALKRMPERVPNLRTNELLPGIGHWTQQEAPEAVNRLPVSFLRSLSL